MPLGTPQRMSPVTTPIDDVSSNFKTKIATVDADAPPPLPTPDPGTASSPTKNEENAPAPSSERSKKGKKTKDKKSKSKDSSREAEVNRVYICAFVVLLSVYGHQQVNESSAVEHASVPPAPSPDKVTSATKKKDKKKGKEVEGNQAPVAEQSKVSVDGQAKSDDPKEKKKKKKSKGDHSAGDPKTDVRTQAEGNENEMFVCNDSRIEADEQAKTVNSKERKKSKDKVPYADVPKVDSEARGEDKEPKERREREKKRKSDKVLDESTAPLAESVTQTEDSKKPSKKRRREGDSTEDGNVAVVNGGRKKTKKSSKDSQSPDTAAVLGEVKDSSASKEPSSEKKRRREEKEGKDAKDAPILEGRKKDKKKRKHKEASESVNE